MYHINKSNKGIFAIDLPPWFRQDLAKGFRLHFHFVENPYFTNTELSKESELWYIYIYVYVIYMEGL